MKARAAALALLAPAAAHASPCNGPVCKFDTLAPYFARLETARAARGVPPLHVLQIGDSHTAGDSITGAWRDLLQMRAGDGGRGVLPPGRPYDFYITQGITASMSPGWRVAATLGQGSSEPHVPLGLAGYSLTSTMAGATMALATDPGRTFDRFVVCAIARPGAGQLVVRMGDGSERRLILAAPVPTPHCETIRAAAPQSDVTLIAADDPVTITSWATFRDDGGVVLSNLGVVGARLAHFGRTDDALLAEELRAYAPDLIVLAFGTNEGFVPRFDPIAYEATLRGQIQRVHALAAGVPLLLLGPPDALSRDPALRSNAAGPATICPDGKGTAPLFAPPALTRIRAIQRRVAGDLGIAWWDWQERMGGICAAARWTAAVPPLMRPDHVHFRSAGGSIIARLLQGDLDRAAARAR
jgi:lysophospholipase L1-like esterase